MMNNSQQIKSKHYFATADLLSDLPDPILCKILSLLPTKNAIATQILSTKWNTVSPFWATPITLDLDDSLLSNPIARKSKLPSISFMSFVDKLFNQTLVEVSQVQVFKLKCHKYYHVTKIASWVCNALRLNVRDLVFNIRLGRRSGVLFNILNGCTTLTSLELGKCFSVRVPDEFTLPNLKVLVLYKLVFGVYEEEDMLFNLITGCPVLEDLCLDTCNLQDWGCVEIDSRVLKKLRMKDSWLDESSCELILEVPNVEVLLYDDCFAGSYDLCDLKSLVLAHIDVGLSEQEIDELGGDDNGTEEQGFWYANGVGMVVAACSSTIRLCLAAHSISVLQRSSEQLPTFRNLTCLELGCMWRSEGWVLLGRLLCNAPCLEKLTIGEGFGTHEEGYSNFLSVLPNPPSCLEVHVREIEFWVFDEEEDEIKLVEYFLMHGKTIQKLSLRCLPFKKSRSCIRLNMLQKHSKIEFQPR